MSYSSEVLADSPLAWYRLDESSGTTMADSSGNGRNGSYVNSPTLGAAGVVTDGNAAMDLGSADSGKHATVANAAWMVLESTITVEAWIYPRQSDVNPDGNGDGVVSRWSSGNPNWLLWRNGSNKWAVQARISGVSRNIAASASVSANTAYHLVFTYDGSTVKLYVNKTLAASVSATGPLAAGGGLPIDIGRYAAASVTTPDAILDEIAIYDYALSSTRIAAHYDAGVAVPPGTGSSSGSFNWSGTATGKRFAAGVAAGAFAFSGAAAGVAPIVGAAEGSSSGSFSWSGSAAGTTTRSGDASGSFAWAGSAAGETPEILPNDGSGSGAFSWAGAAAGTSSRAGSATGAFAWEGTAEGSNSEVPSGTASGTFGWAGIAVGDNGEFEIPTDDEASPIDGATDDDDLEYDPPLALPPTGLSEHVIMRKSVIVPNLKDIDGVTIDPITGQPHIRDDVWAALEADAIVEEVGVPHVTFPDFDDVNDATYYRGLPAQGLRFLRREPFGDADADVQIPGITSQDIHPDDSGSPAPFTRARANMEILLKKSDGTSRRLWSGNVFTRELGNDGRQPTMNLHALGSLYMADSTRQRPVVSDVPLDYGYLIPRAFNKVVNRRYNAIPHIATGILTKERGAWSDSPMGFALDGLAKCYEVDGNQWTIAKVVGSRRSYEMRLKKTEPEWTFTNGARGVYVDLTEDDNGRNIVFGHGINDDGGMWRNTFYPDGNQVTRLPLAADPRTQEFLYDDDGNPVGANPDYDENVLPREDDVDFGQNSKTIGIRSAQQIVDRESVPSFVGRITVETDPREGWRGDIQAGDKLTLIGYQGRDLVLHVSDVEVSLSDRMPVTLTVDERSRDAMTVAQINTRNKEARRDPALRPGDPNRRGRLEIDQIVPFDSESKAGRIMDANGDPLVYPVGQWSVHPIKFATAGRIAKTHMDLSHRCIAGLFAIRPSTAVLNLRAGDPHNNTDPFEWFMDDPTDAYGFIAGWGQKDQRMGFSPYAETGDTYIKAGPFSGKFDEGNGFDYIATASARLYLAVFPIGSGSNATVSGRFYPALVV